MSDETNNTPAPELQDAHDRILTSYCTVECAKRMREAHAEGPWRVGVEAAVWIGTNGQAFFKGVLAYMAAEERAGG